MGAAWNFMSYESKDNLLEAVRRESAGMFELAADAEVWMAATGAGHWQLRFFFFNVTATTETYFVGFDAARGDGDPPPLVPLVDMAVHVDRGAQELRSLDREAELQRLHVALDKMLRIEEALTEEDWGLLVPHKYMGPLPAFFYPVAQLVDYAVHTWDIRQGSGRSHAMDGDAAAILLIGQTPSNALGQHLHRHALGHQVMRQPLGVALHAADDRVEVRRQDQDAFHHRASTVCRRRLQ